MELHGAMSFAAKIRPDLARLCAIFLRAMTLCEQKLQHMEYMEHSSVRWIQRLTPYLSVSQIQWCFKMLHFSSGCSWSGAAPGEPGGNH